MSDYEPSVWEPVAEHVEQYRSSGGQDGFEWNGAEVILLTTTGRMTGKQRITPLIRITHGDAYIVIASQGGMPTNPAWYHNLVADPDVTIQDRTSVHEMRARVAEAEERERLWPLATAQWPDYDTYQASTDRTIPLVVVEPR